MNTALSIAGSDSSSGAGVQADLLTFSAMGCHGATAITSITAQNPSEVSEYHPLAPELVVAQIKAIDNFYKIKAIKTGLLCNRDIITAVVDELKKLPTIPLIVDPVMVSTSGCTFLSSDSIEAYKKLLFPIATLITPNLDEAEVLTGTKITSPDAMQASALALSKEYGTSVLLKGGHLNTEKVYDVFASRDSQIITLTSERIHGINSHGSGCTLSATLTAALANGNALSSSLNIAQAYMQNCFRSPISIGEHLFLNHS